MKMFASHFQIGRRHGEQRVIITVWRWGALSLTHSDSGWSAEHTLSGPGNANLAAAVSNNLADIVAIE
jgi:hypothetical protein